MPKVGTATRWYVRWGLTVLSAKYLGANMLGCDCVCVKVLCPVLLSGTGLVFLLRTGGSPGQWYNATRISAMHDWASGHCPEQNLVWFVQKEGQKRARKLSKAQDKFGFQYWCYYYYERRNQSTGAPNRCNRWIQFQLLLKIQALWLDFVYQDHTILQPEYPESPTASKDMVIPIKDTTILQRYQRRYRFAYIGLWP